MKRPGDDYRLGCREYCCGFALTTFIVGPAFSEALKRGVRGLFVILSNLQLLTYRTLHSLGVSFTILLIQSVLRPSLSSGSVITTFPRGSPNDRIPNPPPLLTPHLPNLDSNTSPHPLFDIELSQTTHCVLRQSPRHLPPICPPNGERITIFNLQKRSTG